MDQITPNRIHEIKIHDLSECLIGPNVRLLVVLFMHAKPYHNIILYLCSEGTVLMINVPSKERDANIHGSFNDHSNEYTV